MKKITILLIIIVLLLCSMVNAQYIQNGSSVIAVQTHEPKGTEGQKAKKPGSSVHIVSTQAYGPFFNGEIVPDMIAFIVTGSSKALAVKLGMTRDEVGAMIRSVNLPVKKAASTWTIDNTITVEYAKDGKASKLAIK